MMDDFDDQFEDEVIAVEFTEEEIEGTVKLIEFINGTLALMAKSANTKGSTKELKEIAAYSALATAVKKRLVNSLDFNDANNRTYH